MAGRLIGRPEELAVRIKAEELRRMEEAKAWADAEADRLEAARTAVQDLAEGQPLGVLLNRLSTISEYRDKLCLVTRTRSYFITVDSEVRAARTARAAAQARTTAAGVAVVWTPQPVGRPDRSQRHERMPVRLAGRPSVENLAVAVSVPPRAARPDVHTSGHSRLPRDGCHRAPEPASRRRRGPRS